ncbi:MAG TPA: hypothetical protein PK635_10850 [Actinomycetota bacterium]|nr:hypothetical protein [Actinomycetota bacterium]
MTKSRQGSIPMRSVRVPEDEWKAAQSRATERGETVTDVIRRALRRYAK